MGSEQSCQSYVSCPKCSTLFKPKSSERKLNSSVTCICCDTKFKLEQAQSRFSKLVNKKSIQKSAARARLSPQKKARSLEAQHKIRNNSPSKLGSNIKTYFTQINNSIKALNSFIYQQLCALKNLTYKLNKLLSDLLINSLTSSFNISKTILTNFVVKPVSFVATKPYQIGNKLLTKLNNTYNSYKLNKSITKTDKLLLAHNIKSKLVFLSSIFMPFLVVSLLSSSIYVYKDDLAQNTKWRPIIEQFCYLVNCNLNTYSDLKYLVIEDNAMVTVPNASNKVQVFAMISNIGKFDQQYPNLKIRFTDINENLITEKIISPEKYLSNSSKNSSKLIAQKSKLYVDVLIDDPGPAAVSYEIALQ